MNASHPIPPRAVSPLASVLLALAALAGLGPTRLEPAELFVAPSGSDRDPGTREKPFATLEVARDAIRRLRQPAGLTPGGVTVWIRGGDYLRDGGFELTAADSGTPAAPIVYRGYANETVRLLGGRRVRDWKPVTDPAVRARLDEKARDQVMQADLRALGITNLGRLQSRGFGRPLTPAHLELFFDGQPMTLARYPNEGQWERIAGIPPDAGENDGHGGQIGKLAQGFLFAGERPARWRNVEEVWVHGYWSWDWANSYERIESLDTETHRLKTTSPYGLYGFRKGQRFYYLNVLEELDEPGEFYVDRRAGQLYFWPPKPVGSAEALVSVLEEPFVVLKDVSHVTLRGLTFEAARGTAITVRGGASNRIAACVLRNLGNYAVRIEGGRGHGVTGCDIEHTGDGGVDLAGGDRQTLTPAGHFVENCHFQRQGRWSKCYVPAIHMNGVGQRASHNLIHDHPHCAILYGGNDHLIEFNEIHHIALETGDVGAIYSGRNYTYRGHRLRHNFIHHTGGVGMGSMGVYMDDCVSGTEVFGNVFYQVQRAVFLGGGRDHQVINNVFVDCNHAVELDGRGLDKSPVWHGMVNDFMRKGLAAVPQTLYRERYPALTNLDRFYGPPGGPAIQGAAFHGVPPEDNVVARNVCIGKWLRVGWHATTNMLELRDNTVGPGAGVVAPEKMDFRLKTDSPAWKTGFQPIPYERIGLQPDEYRRELAQTRS